MDLCNAHAGKGFDYRACGRAAPVSLRSILTCCRAHADYHGDPFGPSCMYSCANYASLEAHPPLLGYGIDGVPIFGRYLSETAPGATTALDDCGGHVHTGMGTNASSFPFVADGAYHYHAFVQTIAANGQRLSYTAYANGPYMCFKGDLSATPGVWLPGTPSASAAYGAGDLAQRADYAQMQPCASMTAATAYVARGFSLPGVPATGNFGDEGLTSLGAGSSGGACDAVEVITPADTTPAAGTAYVAATLTLGGYSATTFGTGEAAAFRAAVAAAASTTAASVTITAVADAVAGRRRTHSTAVAVSFTVASTNSQTAGVSAALSALSVANFAAQGLAVTNVAVTAAPATTQTAPVAAAGLPSTPALTGTGKTSAAHAAATPALALLLALAALQ